MLALRVCLTRFSTSVKRLDRYTRESLRQRIHEKELKEKLKTPQQPDKYPDAIPIRPTSHLIKALGFTAATGLTCFTFAIWKDLGRQQEKFTSFFYPKAGTNGEKIMFEKRELTDGEKTTAALILMNAVVFGMWRFRKLQPAMWRYFTNSYASKSLCSPMILSVFSHNNFIHLALNMYVLYSFTGIVIDKFLGADQFWAVYLTAGVVSSMASLCHKAITKNPVRALGASGAILGILAYTCMRVPDARLKIIFVPFFDFSAQSAVIGLLLFDIAGLLFRFKMFDHAAHLGGALFGIFYAAIGHKLIWEEYGYYVEQAYKSITKR